MLSNSMIRAGTLVLTDFGVSLLVEPPRIILCERQRSYHGGILDYCTRLKCVDGVLAGPLLPHCLPVACFLGCIGRCWMEWIMGLGMVLDWWFGRWSHWMGCLSGLRSIMYFKWLANDRNKQTKSASRPQMLPFDLPI